MNRLLRKYLIHPFMALLLPEKCRVCGAPIDSDMHGLCSHCKQKVYYLGESVCSICGGMVKCNRAAGHICGPCLQHPPTWDQARSAVIYDGPVPHLLHRLKYQADTTVLPALAHLLDSFTFSKELECDLVVPVPLHKQRLQKRGHNQSLHLAKLLFSNRKRLIFPHLLKRQRNTQSQTGLDGTQRRRNLHGAFAIADSGAVRGRSVCLVDDVFTTGTTLEECSKALRSAGAIEITAITVARVKKRKV